MILRVQSPNGTKRIDCNATDSTSVLFQKIRDSFGLNNSLEFSLFKNRDRTHEVYSLERKGISFYNLKHGDMLYLSYKKNGSALSVSPSKVHPENLEEDEIDRILFNQNGYIDREKDKLCQHGSHAKCVHCAPIEPYNESYLHEHNIKHMSFHSYLRKITGGIDKGKFAALENVSCKIKAGCREHLPWPKGICTKCQPNALTLNRQTYRHVDNVMFENVSVVDPFIDYWRTTGQQRLGILYGVYELHKDVPLGIKATVSAIYEPPQENSAELIRLLPDDRAVLVDKIAAHLGLCKVGWIFTDLIAEDLQKGTVKHLRGADTYFLSAQECIMAGHFQNENPNSCRLSPDGFFGSKFVTLCVTGDKENNIHIEGYSVSNQCMALVRDNCLLPTKDAPELGYIRESSNQQYVPDVFYKVKDNYGNEVTELARPLPIEYLLVDVPVAMPKDTPRFTFYSDPDLKAFPIENRFIDGHVQDFGVLVSYLHQRGPEKFLELVSDFHLLIYIATMDMLPLKDALEPLLEAVKTKNRDLADQWSRSEQWATVEQIAAAQGMVPMMTDASPSGAPASPNQAMWTCRHCTYINPPGASCEVCGLPQ